MITADRLNELTQKYETKDFITSDPIQFPHRFNKKEDIEISGFLASLFSYGSRKVFIKKLDELFSCMENNPSEFVKAGDFEKLRNFGYRFSKGEDLEEILKILHKLYSEDGGLEALFAHGHQQGKMLQAVIDYFYSNTKTNGSGFYFMLPNPRTGGAMKRMNMYLRWMVREGEVDFGIWKFMPKSELLIPLDVHVARISRELGLLKRSSNDFKAVVELTEALKKFDAADPIKYDFALFGYGITR